MSDQNQGASIEADLSKLTRWTFDGGMTAEVSKDGQWVRYKDLEVIAARRTPAATTGASSVKPWKARIPMQSTTQECLEAACAEIADLRAQLAATKENLQAAVQEAWNRMTAQHRAEEQLAAKGQGEPVAWAAFADNGNIRVWTSAPEDVRKLAESAGVELIPLYAGAAPASAQPADTKLSKLREFGLKVGHEVGRWVDPDADQPDVEAIVDQFLGAQPDQRESAAVEMIGWAACGCHACNEGRVTKEGWPITATRMILCPTCGNKRCPHASDHALACTGSNEPGQHGSVYGAAAPSPAAQPVATNHDNEGNK